jgi:phospholipid-translocating ATPase
MHIANIAGSSKLYTPNVVRNQKYSITTFFPLVLYDQFKQFSNAYFLVVALSQFVPALKIGEFRIAIDH